MQQSFNTGDYVNAILNKQRAEAISSVLYPDDRTYQVILLILAASNAGHVPIVIPIELRALVCLRGPLGCCLLDLLIHMDAASFPFIRHVPARFSRPRPAPLPCGVPPLKWCDILDLNATSRLCP